MLFDWDGTLVQTLSIWRDALLHSLAAHGYQPSSHAISANYAEFAKSASQLGVDENEIEAVLKTARERIRDTEKLAEPYDEVINTLRHLHGSGVTMGIVTTSTHQQVDATLQSLGIDQLIQVVICSDDVVMQKPDAEPLELAMKRLGATISETIMIGDSPSDIIAAQNAQIDSALYFPPEHNTFYRFASLTALNPTRVIHEFPDIKLLLA